MYLASFLVIIEDFFGGLYAFMPTNGLSKHQVLCMFTRHVYTIAIRLWLLRILEFSLIENVMSPNFRFPRGQFWIIAYNIFSGLKST